MIIIPISIPSFECLTNDSNCDEELFFQKPIFFTKAIHFHPIGWANHQNICLLPISTKMEHWTFLSATIRGNDTEGLLVRWYHDTDGMELTERSVL